MYNKFQIDRLKAALSKMREGLEEFEQYCTEDCGNCPLYKANICGYYMEFVPQQISDNTLSKFVDYYEERGTDANT